MPTRTEYGSMQLTRGDAQCSRPTVRFDSGYTSDDIERILDDLIDAPTQARYGIYAGLMVALALGLGGDEVERSSTSTVMLEEPASVVDARLDAVCVLISRGLSLIEALEALPQNLRRPTDA